MNDLRESKIVSTENNTEQDKIQLPLIKNYDHAIIGEQNVNSVVIGTDYPILSRETVDPSPGCVIPEIPPEACSYNDVKDCHKALKDIILSYLDSEGKVENAMPTSENIKT